MCIACALVVKMCAFEVKYISHRTLAICQNIVCFLDENKDDTQYIVDVYCVSSVFWVKKEEKNYDKLLLE